MEELLWIPSCYYQIIPLIYKEIRPPDYLKDYVRYFWILEGDHTDPSTKRLGPLADGCPGIMFQEYNKGAYFDHENKKLPQTFLYGQTVTRTSIYLSGAFKTVGVRFFPHALRYFFGFGAYELTDSCLDLNLLPKNKETEITEKLLNTRCVKDKIEILSDYLFLLMRPGKRYMDESTCYAVTKIIESAGNFSLRELQKELRMTERSLQRKFKQEVGISPKLFAKVCRFQASFTQLKNNSYTKLSDIAFDNGYADQSHFIRIFKEFTGFSPYQIIKQSPQNIEELASLII